MFIKKTRTLNCTGSIKNDEGHKLYKESINQKWVYWCPEQKYWSLTKCECN